MCSLGPLLRLLFYGISASMQTVCVRVSVCLHVSVCVTEGAGGGVGVGGVVVLYAFVP